MQSLNKLIAHETRTFLSAFAKMYSSKKYAFYILLNEMVSEYQI